MEAVDKKEIAQWIRGMRYLLQEDNQIIGRIIEGWEKGLVDYKEVVAEGELPALLEKLRTMPIPKETKCKQVKKDFEKGIDAQIKARGLVAKYAGGTVPDTIWRPQVVSCLQASQDALADMYKGFASLSKKYQI